MATVGGGSLDPEREFSRCLEAFGESVEELREAERSMTRCVGAMQDAGASPARLLAARSILNQVRGAVRACGAVAGAGGAAGAGDGLEPATALLARAPAAQVATPQLADVAT